MHHYSYAGAGAGSGDPDDIFAIVVTDDSCPRDNCENDGVHLVVMWTGDEYSKRNTWISAESDDYSDLSNMR